MFNKLIAFRAVAVGAVLAASQCGLAQEYISGMKWNEPVVVTPGKTNADPPSDAIILFDGKDLSAWENGDKWTVEDGVATAGKGDITTKQSFGDCQLHIEWSTPKPAKGHGQQRGNSGVFLMDRYEVQVLDSYKDKTYFDGQASAIYKQRPPMVNAMRPPGEWNTYEIVWDAPKFNDDGSLESPAYVTVIHNGVLTQNHFAIEGITDFPQVPHYTKHGKAPIHLQYHGNPVRYRNIWVRETKPIEGTRERGPYFHDHATGKDTPVSKNGSPLAGRITVNGKPLEKGKISLRSSGGGAGRSANVRDGKFDVDVQPGEYTVTIQSKEKGIKEKLASRYSDEERSELRVTVKPGENVIDFDLQSN